MCRTTAHSRELDGSGEALWHQVIDAAHPEAIGAVSSSGLDLAWQMYEGAVMNTANLQMEGILLVLAALCDELRSKDLLSNEDLTELLARAEQGASGRERRLSGANIEAVRFPIRFLRCALEQDHEGVDYDRIAAAVGRARDTPSAGAK